jgi:hypothetical protein
MNLTRIANRVALLFGQPQQKKKFWEDYTVSYDSGSSLGNPEFYLNGIFNRRDGTQEEAETALSFMLDGPLDEANYDGFYGYNQRMNPDITDELEDIIRNSDDFKKLVEQLKNPSSAQQQLISSSSNPEKITMKDYLE